MSDIQINTDTTEDINKILEQYKKTRARERRYYHEIKKNDETFVNKNRERARNHYVTNKDKRKCDYDENKDYYKCKSLYYYYKRKDKKDEFMEKFPEKVQILNSKHFKF